MSKGDYTALSKEVAGGGEGIEEHRKRDAG